MHRQEGAASAATPASATVAFSLRPQSGASLPFAHGDRSGAVRPNRSFPKDVAQRANSTGASIRPEQSNGKSRRKAAIANHGRSG